MDAGRPWSTMICLAMSRSAEFPLLVVAIVFVYVFLVYQTKHRHRDRERRIELVERALESGAIDDTTKRELVAAVVGGSTSGMHPLLAVGWIGLFAGLGMIGLAFGDYPMWRPGIMTTAISFGVVSLPLASRELNQRRTERARP